MLQDDARYRQRWQTAMPRDLHHPEKDTTRIVIFERVR